MHSCSLFRLRRAPGAPPSSFLISQLITILFDYPFVMSHLHLFLFSLIPKTHILSAWRLDYLPANLLICPSSHPISPVPQVRTHLKYLLPS